MEQPFLRRIELRIDQKKTGRKWNFLSDGTRSNQQISFSVIKTLGGTPNQSTITICNLAPATRLALMSGGVEVSLFIGWQNIPMSLLTTGQVLQVIPTREGTDNQTTLSLFDGLAGIAGAGFAKTYPANTTVKQIVVELARAMASEGITVDESEVDVDGVLGERGYVVNGRVARELNVLANSWGFTWSVQSGRFRAIKDTRAGKREHNISAKEGYLFKVSPSLFDNTQLLQGVEISALIQPLIEPGDMINLTSVFYEQYSGRYKSKTITFNGDSHGSSWEMKIQATPFPR
jgi:hypothetical protein